MSQITIKSGKGEITLRKSGRLVGLKTNSSKDVQQEPVVKKKIFNKLAAFSIVTLEKEGKALDETANKDQGFYSVRISLEP